MQVLDFDVAELEKLNGAATAKEIAQQPKVWLKALENVVAQAPAIQEFLSQLPKDKVRIILAGAGTSAFVGRALAPYLRQLTKLDVVEIATTDLVSNPQQYFEVDTPTLLVSFARSGNSPESVAAYNLANQLVKNIYQLVITCNENGTLAKASLGKDNAYVLLMPPETNDVGFAMTSSYSSMLLSCLAVFTLDQGNSLERYGYLSAAVEKLLPEFNQQARRLAQANATERLVYLGSGGLQGLAQEAALKILELTAGKIMATYDSSLGFRHGPKSLVNPATEVVLFASNHPYTRQYDQDLFAELVRDQKARSLVALSTSPMVLPEDVQGLLDPARVTFIECPELANASDVELIFPYIAFAQLLSLHSSLVKGVTPDNPCPTGEVNRVVQGVILHPYNG